MKLATSYKRQPNWDYNSNTLCEWVHFLSCCQLHLDRLYGDRCDVACSNITSLTNNNKKYQITLIKGDSDGVGVCIYGWFIYIYSVIGEGDFGKTLNNGR